MREGGVVVVVVVEEIAMLIYGPPASLRAAYGVLMCLHSRTHCIVYNKRNVLIMY